ncbi:MAG: hypothetical protein COZ06_15015 [Armatimonadetes bacterium CG_4_10_14_3_um_filter_66_18]|nr:MAG: hypothetical protein COZ57_23445 [Armatimonadetes bacterium CG_4_8_14_3_um_filter_66_20]PIY49046.1 MAG: hypothetical protein COZ06_15015 [Armatimonadetes bacterium CG_4_10_14_3_um_filter_66_18]
MGKQRRKSLRLVSSDRFLSFLRKLGVQPKPTSRRRGGSHLMVERAANGGTLSAPVLQGKRELDPEYQREVLEELGFSPDEIQSGLDRHY